MPRMITVVGAGLAGVRTAERLRKRGYDGRLVLIGAERHPPYDRPPLSKQVLRGERDEPWLRPKNDYADLGVELVLGEAASALDPRQRIVFVKNEAIEYDTLIIATGARPRRLPGLDGHVLRAWGDAEQLRARLSPGVRLAVVGAGLIGCEVAASARSLGVDVTLIDALAGPLIRAVGPAVSSVVADLQTGHGVELRLGTTATRASRDRLVLGDGSEVIADVVLEAIGVEPEVEWLTGSGITVDGGVVCDADGRTSADGVFAVGDVAQWDGIRFEHWASAVEQADRVAAAVLGAPVPPRGVPYWWSDQYDVKIQGIGTCLDTDEVTMLAWGPKQRTLALYSRHSRLTGAVGFSAAAAVMGLRPDVAAGTELPEVLRRLAT